MKEHSLIDDFPTIRIRCAGTGDGGVVAKLLRDFNAEFCTPAPEEETFFEDGQDYRMLCYVKEL